VILMTAPCYLCGEPSVIDGLCEKCYNGEHPLISVESPLSITVCKRCGSVRVPGGWKTVSSTKSESMNEEQVGILLGAEIKPLGTDISISIEEVNRLDRVLSLKIHVTGRSAPTLGDHTEEYPVEVRFSYATCDTCGMMSGGYYEAILQIRADGRPVTDREQDEIAEIARELTVSEYGKDNRAFILQIDDTKFGLDMFIGSEHLCKRIADEIEIVYLADRKDNYKLYGQERDGKKKYRITIVLRLPRYTIGDFVEIDDNPCQVLSVGRGGLTYHDLSESQSHTITKKSAKWRTVKFISPESEKRSFSIVSSTPGQMLQVMDSKTFEIHEIESTSAREYVSGDNVYLLEYNGRWYILPSSGYAVD
jgi:nonsense-mediated mRNA decay protein 3